MAQCGSLGMTEFVVAGEVSARVMEVWAPLRHCVTLRMTLTLSYNPGSGLSFLTTCRYALHQAVMWQIILKKIILTVRQRYFALPVLAVFFCAAQTLSAQIHVCRCIFLSRNSQKSNQNLEKDLWLFYGPISITNLSGTCQQEAALLSYELASKLVSKSHEVRPDFF